MSRLLAVTFLFQSDLAVTKPSSKQHSQQLITPRLTPCTLASGAAFLTYFGN